MEASQHDTPVNIATAHDRDGPDCQAERRARLWFLMQSVAYLGLSPGRNELAPRFLWQPAPVRRIDRG